MMLSLRWIDSSKPSSKKPINSSRPLDVIATDCVVIVHPDIDARPTVSDTTGWFYRHIYLSARRPTLRAGLCHRQRNHPSVITTQSEFVLPRSPWLRWRQQSANSVSLNLIGHSKVDVTIDAECLEGSMVKMLLEHSDQEVSHPNIRISLRAGLESIRHNLTGLSPRGR